MGEDTEDNPNDNAEEDKDDRGDDRSDALGLFRRIRFLCVGCCCCCCICCVRDCGCFGVDNFVGVDLYLSVLCIRLENSGEVVASDDGDSDGDDQSVEAAFILPAECCLFDPVIGNNADVLCINSNDNANDKNITIASIDMDRRGTAARDFRR